MRTASLLLILIVITYHHLVGETCKINNNSETIAKSWKCLVKHWVSYQSILFKDIISITSKMLLKTKYIFSICFDLNDPHDFFSIYRKTICGSIKNSDIITMNYHYKFTIRTPDHLLEVQLLLNAYKGHQVFLL